MFDALADKLQSALGDLKGRGTLDDETITRAMREVRLALLEADVNFDVVKQFVAQVRERALGQDVQKSLTPGPAGREDRARGADRADGLRLVADRVLAARADDDPARRSAGLGKDDRRGQARAAPPEGGTQARRSSPPTCSGPPRSTSWSSSARRVDVPVYADERSDPVKAVRDGIDRARADGRDVVILDTAGRLHVDEPLMEELAAVRREAKPTNVLLVLDAMTGQEAVNVAKAFQERIDFDGVVMTKLDGDARGGAALSVKAVTGKPIKLASVGEKLDALEWFHPDRMAGRILGMGDVLTLIERAESAVADDEKEELERRMMKGEFSFDDFLKSYKMLRRMGPLQGVLKMIPGLGKQLEGLDQVDERQLGQVEAIILSMTPHERRVPHVIDGSRRKRIAAGSGTSVEQVNQLIEGRKQMAKMMKMMGSGKMPSIPGAAPTMPSGKPRPSATRKSASKRKKESEEVIHGCETQADARRLEEEPDLPRRRRRLALAARRQVHRDRRTLQPSARAVADRVRRGEGARLAREGCAPDGTGRPPPEGQGHQLGMHELLAELARRLVDEPDAVRIEQVEGDDGSLVFRLHVAEGDVGKVIGRQGRIARALRTVVRAGGPSAGRRLQLEIVG